MVRRAVYLRALLLVAGEANLSLAFFVAHLVAFRVNLVARRASDVTALMRAALPVRAICVTLMATHAGVATSLRCACGVLAESDIRLAVPALVICAFAMAT